MGKLLLKAPGSQDGPETPPGGQVGSAQLLPGGGPGHGPVARPSNSQ